MLDAGQSLGEDGGYGISCTLHVCGGWGGWALPLRGMAVHRVYAPYLPVNLGRPGSAQTADGSWPVRPRRQMPDTRA